MVVNAASRRMNPTLSEAIVARAYERDAQAAMSEFGGAFGLTSAGFSTLRWSTRRLIVAFWFGRRRRTWTIARPAIRAAGRMIRFTLAVAHDEGEIAVLDCLVEIKSPFNPTAAVDDMAATLASYRLTSTTGDRYAAGWVIDAFAKVSMTYVHSERNRCQAYLDTLPLFTAGRVRLLDNPRLVAQFAALERRTTSLRDIVDHGPGGRDDCCNAAALALSGRGERLSATTCVGRRLIPRVSTNNPISARMGEACIWLRCMRRRVRRRRSLRRRGKRSL